MLRIRPGDHVITTTLDAGGTDSKGVKRGQGPNPETSSFYIEDAQTGDTLVVHLLRLETNRATGFSASVLAPYTVDPGFLRAEALREARQASARCVLPPLHRGHDLTIGCIPVGIPDGTCTASAFKILGSLIPGSRNMYRSG